MKLCKKCRGCTRAHGKTQAGRQRWYCPRCGVTTNANNNNYAAPWKIGVIKGLRRLGYSNRRIANIAQVARNTVAKYIKDIDPGLCSCGLPATHQGWCAVRYRQSPKRQEALQGDKDKAATISGLYDERLCLRCSRTLYWGGELCKECYAARAAARRAAKAVTGKRSPISAGFLETVRLVSNIDRSLLKLICVKGEKDERT